MIAECYKPPNCSIGDLRLVGGNSASEGRVELCTQGLWGTIAAYYHWGSHDANVVCRQLGLPWECEFDKPERYCIIILTHLSISL